MILFLLACTTQSTDSSAVDSTDSAIPDSPIECSELSVDECETKDCNLLSGRPATESTDGVPCIDWSTDPQPAGCTSENSSEAVISFAQSPDDVCWFFPSGTVPSGWSECPPVEDCE